MTTTVFAGSDPDRPWGFLPVSILGLPGPQEQWAVSALGVGFGATRSRPPAGLRKWDRANLRPNRFPNEAAWEDV